MSFDDDRRFWADACLFLKNLSVRGEADQAIRNRLQIISHQMHTTPLIPKSYWIEPSKASDFGTTAVSLDACPQIDDSILWAVRLRGYVMNRRGEFEYEPIPSDRNEAFTKRCRFETMDEAISVYRAAHPERNNPLPLES